MLKGIYTLIITCNMPTTVSLGRLGKISFAEGYYAYVGSALNGLATRIARHYKEDKKLYWHIDYFLKEAKLNEVIYTITTKKKECAVASHLAIRLIPIPGFGCSDCRCKSHLYFAPDKHFLKKKIRGSFKSNSLVPRLW